MSHLPRTLPLPIPIRNNDRSDPPDDQEKDTGPKAGKKLDPKAPTSKRN